MLKQITLLLTNTTTQKIVLHEHQKIQNYLSLHINNIHAISYLYIETLSYTLSLTTANTVERVTNSRA